MIRFTSPTYLKTQQPTFVLLLHDNNRTHHSPAAGDGDQGVVIAITQLKQRVTQFF